jgi:thioredoxin 1
MFAPIFENASTKHPDIVFGKVDTEGEPSLAAAAGIRSIPTLMAFRDGILVSPSRAHCPRSRSNRSSPRVRELDMDDVRAKLVTARVAMA